MVPLSRHPLFAADGTLPAGLLAGLLFGLEFVLIFVGLEYTTVARSTLMVNTMPFWVLIGAHFLLGERMSLAKFAGLALAFAGVVLVFSDKLSLPEPIGDHRRRDEPRRRHVLGGDRRWSSSGRAWPRRARKSCCSTSSRYRPSWRCRCCCLPDRCSARSRSCRLPRCCSRPIYIVAVTYVLWFWLMRRYPAAGLSSFAFLTPVFGVLCGGLLLDEPLSIRIFLALALIGAGLIIVNRPQRQKA